MKLYTTLRQRLFAAMLYTLLMSFPFGFAAQAGLSINLSGKCAKKTPAKTNTVKKAKHPLDFLVK